MLSIFFQFTKSFDCERSVIYKDSKGFVWISSTAGLNRFDGRKIKVYENLPKDSTSIFGQNIHGEFSEDDKTNIWFTTHEALHYYLRENESFRHFFIRDSNGRPIPGFYNCGIDDQKKLWIIHNDSLYLFNTIEHKFLPKYPLAPNTNRGVIQLDKDGWVKRLFTFSFGGFGMLKIEDPGSNTPFIKNYFSRQTQNNLPQLQILDILPDENSIIWIATDKGLVKFNPFNDELLIYDKFGNINVGMLSGVVKYDTKYLAVTSFGNGLLFFDKDSLKFKKQLKHIESSQFSISSNFPDCNVLR